MSIAASPDESALPPDADRRCLLAVDLLGGALNRLAAGYETNPAEREDLLQEIHLQLWRSLSGFDGRCSLRSWVYRVAHNVAADHVGRAIRRPTVSLELADLDDTTASVHAHEEDLLDRITLTQLYALLYRLGPIDRQVMLLYLEGESAAVTAEVCGLSPGAVATRIHRLKAMLGQMLKEGVTP